MAALLSGSVGFFAPDGGVKILASIEIATHSVQHIALACELVEGSLILSGDQPVARDPGSCRRQECETCRRLKPLQSPQRKAWLLLLGAIPAPWASVLVKGYATAGGPRFDARDPCRRLVARHGLTAEQYQIAFNDYVGNHGMQLILLSQRVAGLIEKNHVFGKIDFSACGGAEMGLPKSGDAASRFSAYVEGLDECDRARRAG